MIKRIVSFKPSVKELADAFVEMSGEDQAKFLSLVATSFESWGAHGRNWQLIAIAERLAGVKIVSDFVCDLLSFIATSAVKRTGGG